MNGRLKKLEVQTTSELYAFTGEEAKVVYDEIFRAGARGNAWTNPIQLNKKQYITFVLDNIVSFTETYEKEETS